MRRSETKTGDSALLAALASGRSVNEAAKAAGISRATVYRRLEESDFKNELDRVRRETLDRTTAQLSEAGLAAVKTLRELLKSGKELVRLSAARCILEVGDRYRTALDVDDRLSVLESSLSLENKGGR